MTTPLPLNLLVTGRCLLEYCHPRGKQMEPPAGEVTLLLRAWSAGDRTVEERLFELVLPELRVLARQLVSKERREHTLSPTALLNEAYLRLLVSRERDSAGRCHFFAIAARIMRRLLIDYARAHMQTVKVRLTRAPGKLAARIAGSRRPSRLMFCSMNSMKRILSGVPLSS